MIPVTQSFLPPMEEYNKFISKLWDTKWLTNNGEFVQQLERELMTYLHVPSLHFVNNGTMALQLAIKSLQIKKKVITTPFSFVATTTAILWEDCEPVFVDIDPETLCIDARKIEAAITDETEAILATHVFGVPCDVEKIEEIAAKHNLKVIYDAAHAFGVKYKGTSVLNYGDVSTLSFHSTKLFHTVEGGAIIHHKGEDFDQQIELLRSFGFVGEDYRLVGTNAKNSELHAAMGLCNLKYVDELMMKRKTLCQMYDLLLENRVGRPFISNDISYNYAYYPVMFQTEQQLLSVMERLSQKQIYARRYFYPSLNTLPYLNASCSCPISEDVAKRIVCLPLYHELEIEDVKKIATCILERV
ncbi:DegT/DnrJ/EryC1/StrS family aminotransferase [Bacillus sp. Hm123]|uniref:DegT/DnrJ/EryC1/StrS family aminotransferase n=1 Tax=Bacillus sp. Hm123 TaxID=3450745 RepID=UPI003F44237A